MIAGFILLRLRSILGKKTGHDGKASSIFDDKKFEEYKAQLNSKPILKEVSEEDEKKQFLKGAEIAYETILTSFAKGKKDELKRLLTKSIYSSFEQVIDQRNKEGIKSEFTFIGIKDSKIEKYEKIENELFATVKIVCEIISVKRDKAGEIIEGNPDKIKTVTDHWKFTKTSKSKNPNWYLAEIVSK
jgi:predicted lipid-binding transport protein (Tim44 family)